MIRLEPPDSLSMSIGEAMFTQRAIRRLDPNRPVEVDDIRTMLEAASKAPSGGNSQPVRFLVLKDREIIRQFGALYYEAWWAKRFDDYGWNGPEDLPANSFYASPARLASEMKDVPAVVLAFSPDKPGAESSVFPPVQNLLLAARALGVGSVLTTLHAKVMDRVYALLGVPADIRFHCALPLGYPRGAFGPTQRYPSSHTTHWDRWEGKSPWT
jgi:nitroreductase